MAESSPLLVDIDDDTRVDANNEDVEPHTAARVEQLPASSYFNRPVKNLTALILGISVLTVLILIANYIILQNGPFKRYIWQALEANIGLGAFLLIALVVSIINIYVRVPILLNMIADITLALYIFQWTASVISSWPENWCRVEYGYPRPDNPNPEPILPSPNCDDWKLVVRILMGIAAGLGGIVGVLYLVLLVLRTIALFRTKFWKRPLPFTFATGQFSLEITMKILKQDTGEDAVRRSVEARAASVHGPQDPVAEA